MLMTVAATRTSPLATPELRVKWPMVLFLLALPLATGAQIALGASLPLWFDEVYTGTVAGQPTLRGLLDWCLTELTGPAFYGPMWLWARVAGVGDTALRIPALVLSIVTPLVIARHGHPDRTVRLFWATITALWLPMLALSTEARSYPQLFLLGSIQSILFLRLHRSLGRSLVLGWATVTALAALTHYYALVIGGFEGLALIVAHRRALDKLLPAALPFGILAGWMAFHLPMVVTYASHHATHYQPLPLGAVTAVPWFLFGQGPHGFLILALLAFTCSTWWKGVDHRSAEAQLVWAGVATFALIVGVGLLRATMMPRYLTPGMPALLFGLACWAQRMRERAPMLVAAMFATLVAAIISALVVGSSDDRFRERRTMEFETASVWLMERSPTRLHLVEATPTVGDQQRRNMAEIAGFFFARAGRPIAVALTDPVRTYADVAASDRGDAILSLYDGRSSKRLFGKIASDPQWQCRDFGSTVHIRACRRSS